MKPEPKSEIILYQTEDNRTRIEVRLENETVWLTQAQISDLFQRERSVITKHIRNLFEEGELVEEAVCASYAHTDADGKTYQTAYYNLDVIISVGYRVKSPRGTQFRIWATQRLREYIVKGFTLDDERLKKGGTKNEYYDELLQRIRGDSQAGQCHAATNGADLLERRKGTEVGRRHRKELSHRGGVEETQPDRDAVSGFRGVAGVGTAADDDARLDCQTGRVPARRRPANPGARREHFRRRGETEGGTGV